MFPIIISSICSLTYYFREHITADVSLIFLFQSGKDCLGEVMYRYITADKFSPECLLDYLDLTSEYTTLEIANRIEASVHIWKQKYLKLKRRSVSAKIVKSSWGGTGIGKVKKGFVGDIEKSKVLAQRSETLLHNLRVRFPGLPRTSLDMTKIQYNKVLPLSLFLVHLFPSMTYICLYS